MKQELDEQTLQRIQEEIRTRVFAKYDQQQGVKSQVTEIEATVEALHDVTNLPIDEIEEIAKAVTREYLSKNSSRPKSKVGDFTPSQKGHSPQVPFFEDLELKLKQAKRKFYPHLVAYTAVNFMLFTIYLFSHSPFPWFMFPLLGWGIGLVSHYMAGVRFPSKDLQEKRQQLTSNLHDILAENLPEYQHRQPQIYNGTYRMLTNGATQEELHSFMEKIGNTDTDTAEHTAQQLVLLRTSIVGERKMDNIEKFEEVVSILRGEGKRLGRRGRR